MLNLIGNEPDTKMKYIKKIIYYYSNFLSKAGRLEYSIYIIIQILLEVFIYDLYSKTDWNERSVINLFYIWSIILVTFIPIQAVTTRRLRDMKINGGLIFLNYIPGINVLFKLYLILAKSKKKCSGFNSEKL